MSSVSKFSKNYSVFHIITDPNNFMKTHCKPILIAMYCTRKLEGAIKEFGGFEATFFVGIRVRKRTSNGILLPKLFWPTVRKNCSSDREKLLKFEAEGREFAKILRSLEQFIQTVKGQNNFW